MGKYLTDLDNDLDRAKTTGGCETWGAANLWQAAELVWRNVELMECQRLDVRESRRTRFSLPAEVVGTVPAAPVCRSVFMRYDPSWLGAPC